MYRFDVYPNRISPLLQLRKDGHLYGNRHADYETVINGKELDMRKIERMTPIPAEKEFVLQHFFWQAALYREDVE